MIFVLILLLLEIGLIGYLGMKKLDSLSTKIFNLSEKIEELPSRILTRDQLVGKMSIKEMMKERIRIEQFVIDWVEQLTPLLINIIAAGTSKALGGKKRGTRS